MKKVFGAIAGLVFGLFGLGIIALVMSLTYSGLQRIFPDNPANQMWGLVIFDIAVIAWALAFAFKSNSLGQYGAAGAGFLVGFAGTGLMVYAEVTLSGQQLTGGAANTAEIGQWMIWAFVAGSLVHVALLWMHHATDPDLATQISTGVAQGLIRDKARAGVEHQLEVEAEYLAREIAAVELARARRNMHVPGAQTIIDLPALSVDNSLHVPSNGYPTPAQEKAPSIFSKQYWQERFGKKQDPRRYEQAASQVEAASARGGLKPEDRAGYPDNYGPLWNSSTNITPTLDAYNWVCLHCDGTNQAFTRTCSWCGQSRTNGSPVTALGNIPPKPQAAEAEDYSGIAPELYAKGTIFTDPADQARHDAYHAANPDADEKARLKAEAKALGMWDPNDPNDSPFERSRPEVHRALTQSAKEPGAKPSPFQPE